MAKRPIIVYACTECGSQSAKWLGRCPDCTAWNSFVEEKPAAPEQSRTASLSMGGAVSVAIDAIGTDLTPRISTNFVDLDRVFGGGIVPGSITLIGGEPGIGKSTLLLQVAQELCAVGPVLYVSGEESPRQIALRARRLGTLNGGIALYSETSVEKIILEVERIRPAALIIDSIQTAHTSASNSGPGSLAQVRDSAGMLMALAKRLSLPVFLIGHITKEGAIAGPKTLEHIVDTVLYFEGEKFQNRRLIRAFKNRFGPVNEVALYEMHDSGLHEVGNPSASLIAERSAAAGSAIVAALEGTRPLLIEVQGLVSLSHFPSPRRMAIGLDSNRVSLLVAVLEKRNGALLSAHDIYVNVAGGLQLEEPAIDLGVIAALISSHTDTPLPLDTVLFGEVGLLGEIRSVNQAEARANEAAALGFRRIVVPEANRAEIRADIEVSGVKRIEDLTGLLFPSLPTRRNAAR